MQGLIHESKCEHARIEEMFARARDTGITNSEAHQILIAAQEELIAHLQKEDEKLYPVLKRAATVDPLLRQTLEYYARDLEAITSDAVAFFQRYSTEDAANDIEFAKAFGHLYSAISRRIRNEEKTLYPAYEKMFA